MSEPYGRISNEELLQAIDLMTFEHGATEILVGSRSAETSGKDVRKGRDAKKNQGAVFHDHTLTFNDFAGRDDWI